MASLVDFTIAVGIFIVFVAFLFIFLTSTLTNYRSFAESSELKSSAISIFESLFSGKGIPSNWEESNYTPAKIGLVSDLYRVLINVTELNQTNRGNIAVNSTISFDSDCQNKAWNTSVRVVDINNTQINFAFFNTTFCSQQWIKQADVVFNTTLNSQQSRYFYVYYSPEKFINSTSFPFAFPQSMTNITVNVTPEERITVVSPIKLKTLRNQTYEDVIQTISTKYKMYIEVGT